MLVAREGVCDRDPRERTKALTSPQISLALIGFGEGGWGPRFLSGAILTVEISLAGYVIGSLLGLAGVGAKLSRHRWLRWLGATYTTLVRAVPELLLIILLYYTGTSAIENFLRETGLSESFTVNPFLAAVVTLGFVQGAYLTEVFRGGILAVPIGVSEAGRALALRPMQRFRLLILPIALRHALPGMGNLWLVILKDSSLISVVGFSELLFTGKTAASATKLYLFFYCFTAGLFLALTVVSSIFLGFIQRRSERGQVRT